MRSVLAGIVVAGLLYGLSFGMVRTIGWYPALCFAGGTVFGFVTGHLVTLGLSLSPGWRAPWL